MKVNRVFPVFLVALASLALVGCEPATVTPDLPPQQVTTRFYRWYIGYPGNPLVDREYRYSPYLAESFVQEIDEALENLSQGGADPILLAQDVPERLAIGEVSVEAERAETLIYFYWSGNPTPSQRRVDLQLIDGAWLITGVSLVEP